MTYWKNKKTGDIYRLLAYAIDSTNERNGLPVIVYCPDDNGHAIFVREEKEFFSKFEPVEPYCGSVDHYIQGEVNMKYYITKYALTSGIQIVESNKDNNLDNKFNNDESGCVFQYNYLIKNKEIFRNKEDAEKNFEQRKLKKIESLKNQISKLEKMKLKYEKDTE